MKIITKILCLGMFAGLFAAVTGCGGETVPKPKAYLRLEYPEAQYVMFNQNCPFSFDVNAHTIIKDKGSCNLTVQYPRMKATIYLTYKSVNNNINLLLRDAQKLTYEHVIKADEIQEQPFVNRDGKVYGMFYKVGGNAATNAQFYVTDSTKHFLTGSMYFYAKPNFDSIMPAASYIMNDMQNIMETINWK